MPSESLPHRLLALFSGGGALMLAILTFLVTSGQVEVFGASILVDYWLPQLSSVAVLIVSLWGLSFRLLRQDVPVAALAGLALAFAYFHLPSTCCPW